MKDEALKLALEALESVLANHNGAPVLPWIEARNAIRQTLAQPEERYIYGTPLLDAMTKDYVQERNFCERCGKRVGGEGDIHTCTPPAVQRQWVGLTDEERNSLLHLTATHSAIDFAKACEAKLKEKNT